MKERLARLRAKWPFFDHLMRMQEHYSAVKGSLQAGAVTYFAFLSFFPILALAFFVIGYIAKVYPDAQADLVSAISSVLPNLIGDKEGELSLDSVQDAAGAVGLIGLVGVTYSGLGWLSAMREALMVVFEKPAFEQPNFVKGKLRDLVTLGLIGVTLVLSVAVSGVVTTFSEELLELVRLGSELSPLLAALAITVGLLANMVLFFALFKLLAAPEEPNKALWKGALLGAIGFELLKQASRYLIASTENQPAFQAFGISLILLVWINYFSRVVVYAASFAHTSPSALAQRVEEPDAAQGPALPSMAELVEARTGAEAGRAGSGKGSWAAPAAAGAAAMLGIVAVVRRRKRG